MWVTIDPCMQGGERGGMEEVGEAAVWKGHDPCIEGGEAVVVRGRACY
jgi:hypothetical protein